MNERMRLLVGYDGSDCSNAALEDLQLAGLPSKGEILVVSVAELWLPSPRSLSLELADSVFHPETPTIIKNDGPTDQSVRLSTTLARQAGKRLKPNFPGWQIQAEGHSGSAARQILNRAEEWKADLIVVGSRGHSG